MKESWVCALLLRDTLGRLFLMWPTSHVEAERLKKSFQVVGQYAPEDLQDLGITREQLRAQVKAHNRNDGRKS